MAMLTRVSTSAGFSPAVGGFLTVRLPGEVMRCLVDQVVDRDRVIIEIDGVPMSKAHSYRKGDKTGARRRTEHGRDIWEALDDRDFLANRSPSEPVSPVVAETKKVAAKPRAKKRRAA